MFLIAVKTLLDLVVAVSFISSILLSLWYFCSAQYRMFVYDIIKHEDDPDFLDWYIIVSVFPGVLLWNLGKKLLQFVKKYVTIVYNYFRPKEIKVVIYYVPKHWRRDKWEHHPRMR